MLDGHQKLREDRIEVCFREPDRRYAEETASSMAKAADALTAYFEIDRPLPLVRAILAPDRDAFDRWVADVLNVEIEKPSDPRRIAQAQKTEIVFLSPSAYAAHSTYRYVPNDYRRMVHHELVHVFQEHLSPGIEESPLWWDEGMAVYLSDQWRHDSQFRFREPVLETLRAGRVPALAAILADPSLAYSFGWTVVRFIEQKKGKGSIVRVVREMKDGDVLSALGENIDPFERAWTAWFLNRAASDL